MNFRGSNWMGKTFCCDIFPQHKNRYKFYTCHDNIVAVSCANFCCYRFIAICVSVKWNIYRILIASENPIGELGPRAAGPLWAANQHASQGPTLSKTHTCWHGLNVPHSSLLHNTQRETEPIIFTDKYKYFMHPGGRLNIKISSCQYRDPHVKDKTVSRPSYL